MELNSPHNPKLKYVVKLRTCSERQESGEMIVEGYRECRRALDAGYRPHAMFHCPDCYLKGENEPALVEECARLGEIFDAATKNSLVLLDESLSSTGSFEASYIASEVLLGLSKVGCRTIFSTHLHELAAEVAELNERAAREGGSPIDTLVAGMEAGERSFRIRRAKPDGKSYAGDIAKRYGLTYEDIRKRIQK